MRRLTLPNYVRREGAKFEYTDDFLKNTVVVDSTQQHLGIAGVPLTYVDENTYATSKDELHCFIIGDSGCGKTRRIILPSILLMAKTGQSMVIADPKGELYKKTANGLKNQGYSVFVLNFRNPSRGSRWNPLGLIERMYRSGDQEQQDRAVLMLKDIVDIMKKEGESQKDRFWENAASKVFIGIAYLILEYGDVGDLTFKNISIAAKDVFSELGKNTRNRFNSTDNDESKDKKPLSFVEFLATLPKNSPIIENLSIITSVEKETRNSIIGVFENMVSVYTNQTSLQDLFSRSEIDIEQLGKIPTALFFILPDDSGALYPIATVFVKQIYSTLVNLADSHPSGELENRVTFLLDEFANFAQIPSFDSMLTAARSRGVRFVLVCQSMEQLNKKYKEDGAEILLANCRLWIYMSCRNLPFLKRLATLIGDYISPYTGERYPLIDVSELQHFEMGQVLILNDRSRPMMGFLPDFDKYDFGLSQAVSFADIPSKNPVLHRECIDIMSRINSSESDPKDEEVIVAFAETSIDRLRNQIQELLKQKASSDTTRESRAIFEESTSDIEAQDDTVDQTGIEFSPRSLVLLFLEDDISKVIHSIIEDVESGDLERKVLLAFFIRFNKIDVSKYRSSFLLKIPDLLKDFLESDHPHAIINMAMFSIEMKEFDSAIDLFAKLDCDGWRSVSKFWHSYVWILKHRSPEGALICSLIHYRCGYTFDNQEIMIKTAKHAYPELFENDRFLELIGVSKQDHQHIDFVNVTLSRGLIDVLDRREVSPTKPKARAVRRRLKNQIEKKLNELQTDKEDPGDK
jgi:hypothetical protein